MKSSGLMIFTAASLVSQTGTLVWYISPLVIWRMSWLGSGSGEVLFVFVVVDVDAAEVEEVVVAVVTTGKMIKENTVINMT